MRKNSNSFEINLNILVPKKKKKHFGNYANGTETDFKSAIKCLAV